MDLDTLKRLLDSVAQGNTSVDQAAQKLTTLSYENINYAHIDHQRSLRKGFPEVIFGEGKTAEQIIGIMERMSEQENIILVTRINPDKAISVKTQFPQSEYDAEARLLVLKKRPITIIGKGLIAVLTAGTSDIHVAKEALLTAQTMGNEAKAIFDVGVAGIHRLLGYHDILEKASVLIVVAGMEGALPSVVAGMVSRPVIAVPTSIGYGVSFGGLTALFAMLNSCSSNVAVVNIDNGFGAGYMASMINRTSA